MSELSATNCGCGCENGGISNGNNSCLWIILLLCCCGGFGGGCNGGGCGWATISAETTPVCGSSCSFAAAVDADSDSPLSKNSPVHILHRGVFCIGFHICGRSVYFSSFKGLFCPSSHCLLRSSCTSSSVILRFSIQSSSISYTAFPSMINFRFMPRTLLLFFSLL